MTGPEFINALPPARRVGGRRPSAKIDAFVDALKARPGEWAIWKTYQGHDAKGSAGRSRPLRVRGCEIAARSNGAGTVTIYVRWPEVTLDRQQIASPT